MRKYQIQSFLTICSKLCVFTTCFSRRHTFYPTRVGMGQGTARENKTERTRHREKEREKERERDKTRGKRGCKGRKDFSTRLTFPLLWRVAARDGTMPLQLHLIPSCPLVQTPREAFFITPLPHSPSLFSNLATPHLRRRSNLVSAPLVNFYISFTENLLAISSLSVSPIV